MKTFRGAGVFDQLSPGVRFLIVSCVAVFLAQMVAPEFFTTYFALLPVNVIHKYWIWQLVTYSFLHGSGWHIFFNVFALWMFAPHVENYLGTRTFLTYYFICVVGAGLSQLLVAPDSMVVGASGGIYGLLIAFGLLFPDAVIYLFFIFPLRAIQAVFFIAAMTFVSSLSSGGSRIAHVAHLGGMLTGLIYFKFPLLLRKFNIGSLAQGFKQPFRSSRFKRPRFELHDLSSEVDRILDKISSQGVDSLTDEEHKTMERYAKRKV